jgi:hypothetical protein
MAIGTAIFSNIVKHNIPKSLPENARHAILDSIFAAPNLDGMVAGHQDEVLGAYLKACTAVFIFWAAIIAVCLCLCVFVKDKGLKRKAEREQEKRQSSEAST